MVAFRDLKVSQDIAKWAELGKFEQEFIVYGCCYLSHGERYYHIGDQIVEVSRFARERLLEGDYVSPIIEWLNRVLVPSGLQEEYTNLSKLQLAQRMQTMYPKIFLEAFNHLAKTPHNDSALPILKQLQHAMIACFDHKVLELAEGIALIAFQQKKLSLNAFEMFRAWVNDRYLQMADDVIVKKEVKRTFYGFAYRTSMGKVRYYCNAFENEAYKRHYAVMCQGNLCTPIISATFYYDQMPDMAVERQKFIKQLETWMDDEYWLIVDSICALPTVVNEGELSVLREKSQRDDALVQMIGYYSTLWQV